MATGYNAAFSPAVRKSPIDNTDYELNDAYKPTGATTQPERSLTGGATASAPGAGANSVYGPKAPEETSSGLATSSHSNVVQDPYAPLMQHLSTASQNLESAYSAPHAGTARQIFGAILSRRNPGLGGLVSGETQRNRGIEQAQQDYGIASGQLTAARTLQNQQVENNLKTAQTNYANKHADVIANPPPKPTPEEQAVSSLQSTVNPDTNKNYTPDEAYIHVKQSVQDTKPAPVPKEETPDQQAISALMKTINPRTRQPYNAYDARVKLAQAVQDTKPEKEGPGTMMAVPQPDGTSKIIRATPGMTLPKGAETVPELGKPPKGPSAQEQNRADLAENLNENLDSFEDIVKRRPELFGPMKGRLTEAKIFTGLGTDDPDIGKLANIKHQMGMAQISAHGMRSAQGVEGAAGALANFHHDPVAIKGAIDSARNSVKTFSQDVEKKSGGGSGGGSSAPPVNSKDPLGILQ